MSHSNFPHRAAQRRWKTLMGLVLAAVLLAAARPASGSLAPPAYGALQAVPWWDAQWSHRLRLTFNNTAQAENLVEFPVLVVLNSSRLDYGRTQDAGQDLRFVDAGAAPGAPPLAYEIERWDESGNSLVWVKVPQIDAGSSSDHIYLYYGNPAAPAGQNPAATWNSGYRAVWHLKENPAGGAPQFADSTANRNHGTAQGGMTAASQSAGQVNGALRLDGSNDYVSVPNAASLHSASGLTLEAWVNPAAINTSRDRYLLDKDRAYFLDAARNFAARPHLYLYIDGNWRNLQANTGLAAGAWQYVAGTYDASSRVMRIFVNGVQRGQTTLSGLSSYQLGSSTNALRLGMRSNFSLDGVLDELRISGVSRSPAWIAAQHRTMTDAFAAYGPAEGNSLTPPSPAPSATGTATATATLTTAPSATPTRTPTATATRTASALHPADGNGDGTVDDAELLALFQRQLADTAAEIGSFTAYPRYVESNRWVTRSASDWTAGFFPGALWYMYAYTGSPQWRTWAESWTAGLEGQKTRTDTHDIGFTMTNSFVRGYELTGNAAYKAVALQAANSLATRYDPDVRAIRSWSFGSWSYPVIIDNLMNLELLFWAARNGGSANLYTIAANHAATTLRDHVRADGTVYHLVDYNPSTGAVVAKTTHQGYNTESTWARGQAWGIYGFTIAYRETGNAQFLDAARRLADYYIANVPKDDWVPYWDFEAPDVPNADRDSSGAAITASALFELSRFPALSAADQQRYRSAAESILDGLRSAAYLVNPDQNNAILLHSYGVHPDARQGAAAPGAEVDVPIIFTDMYFIEAMLRRGGAALPPAGTPTATSPAPATPTATPGPTQTPLPPATLTFLPIIDSYVDAARASANMGTIAMLRTYVSPEQRSYLRFDVSGLAGRPVTRAVLRVYANGSSSVGFAVRSVADNAWRETTLNYNNMPPVGNVIANSGQHGGARFVTVDITAYITGDGAYNLALTTTSTKIVSYPSREATANQPQLIIEVRGL